MHNEDSITSPAQNGRDDPEQQLTTLQTVQSRLSPNLRTPRPLRVEYRQIEPPPTDTDLDSILARIYDLALLRQSKTQLTVASTEGTNGSESERVDKG